MFEAFAGRMMAGPQMMGGYTPFGFGGLGIIGVIGFLFIAAGLVALLVWLFSRRPAGQAAVQAPVATTTAEDSALAIVRDRLARGEIDAEQYATIVEALRQ